MSEHNTPREQAEIAPATAATFGDIVRLIQTSRGKIFAQANRTLMELYWQIGKTISDKVAAEACIFSRRKSRAERAFYLAVCGKEGYSSRELQRQIDAMQFERTILGNQKLSATLRALHPGIDITFKDSYVLEFLGLPSEHGESELQTALIQNMKQFILELGSDFIFMGEQHRLQVGNQDFYIDLLFFHRGLCALVAFELKIGKFRPEHLGQLSFYLEALDRDVKKPHENPSIGVLLCRDKDDEVIEYALSRNLSPALVAEYQLQLPDKKLLQARLHELLPDEWPDLAENRTGECEQ